MSAAMRTESAAMWAVYQSRSEPVKALEQREPQGGKVSLGLYADDLLMSRSNSARPTRDPDEQQRL